MTNPLELVINHEARATSEWEKFEKVEGILKTTNEYISCYQKLKDNGELVVLGTTGEKAPRHNLVDLEKEEEKNIWSDLSEEEKLQQLYATAEIVMEDMMELCEDNLPEFSEHVSIGPLKKQDRVIEKRDNDYNGDVRRVIDIVRCSVLLEALSQAKEIIDGFKPGGRWSNTWTLVRCKDGFEKADNFLVGGYRDIKLNVRHVGTGQIAEIQLHLEAFYQIKNSGGHQYYAFARTLKVEGVTNAVSVLEGLSDDLNWKIAAVGEKKLDALGDDNAALRYPIERRLGELYASMWCHGKYAVVKYDAALRHCEKTHGTDAVESYKILMELVYCVSEMQRHCDREDMRSEDEKWMTIDLIPMIDCAIDGFTQLLSERHPFTIKAMRIKADVYDSTTDLIDEAKALYYEVLDMQTEILGPSHPDTIETLNNFGDLLSDDDDTIAEGFECYQKGLDGALKRMYYNHPTARMLVANMIGILEEDGWGWGGGAKCIPDGDKRLRELLKLSKMQEEAQNFQ